VAENHDLERALSAKTALVIAVVLALGFLVFNRSLASSS